MLELGIAQLAPARIEKRNYTEMLTTLAVAEAGGVSIVPLGLGALEIAAGLYSRAFASAEVSGPRAGAVSPDVLARIGRELIRAGESLHVVVVDGARIELRPVASWDVLGGVRPASWLYRVSISGPSVTETETTSAAGVIHCRFASTAGEPWRGRGPLWWARDTSRLAAALEHQLADEVGGASVGQVIPIPVDGGDGDAETDPHAALKADLRTLRGRTALVETTHAAWGEGAAARPAGDWTVRRLGPNPPATLAQLREDVERSVLAACGVPPGLSDSRTDGTAQRESYRRWLHSSVQPLARLVEAEISEKLEAETTLSFRRLEAGDVAGRARAWRGFVGKAAAMDDSEARKLAGLE